MMSQTVFSSALSLARSIRERRLSAVEAVEIHLAQIDHWNPHVNAIVTIDEEWVRTRAKEADEALGKGRIGGALHGVPVTVKDVLAVQGVRTTSGYPPLTNYVPAEDAAVVARLRAAGAILLGKTNTETLTLGFQCRNSIFGRTNNPWDVDRTSGGSSGGDAVAVACGMSALSIGTDSGGSVRIPAHFCGVCALKPTEGRISTAGIIPHLRGVGGGLRHLNTVGLIARSVEDLMLGLRLSAGPDERQRIVPPVTVGPMSRRSWAEYRVAWIDEFTDLPASEDTRAALLGLASDLKNLGCTVERRSPNIDRQSMRSVSLDIFALEFQSTWDREDRPDIPAPVTHPAPDHELRRYMQALERREYYIEILERFFDQWDVLISPVSVGPAFPHCATGTPISVDGKDVDYWSAGIGFTSPYNLTGHPAVVLPLARTREGLPIGVQLIGKRWGDMEILSLAQKISKIMAPFPSPSHD